jgi:hypothetical protein
VEAAPVFAVFDRASATSRAHGRQRNEAGKQTRDGVLRARQPGRSGYEQVEPQRPAYGPADDRWAGAIAPLVSGQVEGKGETARRSRMPAISNPGSQRPELTVSITRFAERHQRPDDGRPSAQDGP